MPRTAVLPYIHQALLHDAQQFPANLIGHLQVFNVGYEARGNPRLSLKPLH